MKHIDIRFHFIQWIVEDGKMKLIYCPTEEMVADIMTKALPSIKVKHFAVALGLSRPWGGVLNIQGWHTCSIVWRGIQGFLFLSLSTYGNVLHYPTYSFCLLSVTTLPTAALYKSPLLCTTPSVACLPRLRCTFCFSLILTYLYCYQFDIVTGI